jgi:hypothetical protein
MGYSFAWTHLQRLSFWTICTLCSWCYFTRFVWSYTLVLCLMLDWLHLDGLVLRLSWRLDDVFTDDFNRIVSLHSFVVSLSRLLTCWWMLSFISLVAYVPLVLGITKCSLSSGNTVEQIRVSSLQHEWHTIESHLLLSHFVTLVIVWDSILFLSSLFLVNSEHISPSWLWLLCVYFMTLKMTWHFKTERERGRKRSTRETLPTQNGYLDMRLASSCEKETLFCLLSLKPFLLDSYRFLLSSPFSLNSFSSSFLTLPKFLSFEKEKRVQQSGN